MASILYPQHYQYNKYSKCNNTLTNIVTNKKLLPENYTIDHSIHKKQDRVIETEMIKEKQDNTPSETLEEHKSYNCMDCGKSYKSLNCLQKHQWEHSEQWEYTSKFLLTKHQQVQMLEAASILMNIYNKKRKLDSDTLLSKKKQKLQAGQDDIDEDDSEDEDEDDTEIDVKS